MEKKLNLGTVEAIYVITGNITGSGRQRNGTPRSAFDAGTKLSYAFGRTQKHLQGSIEALNDLSKAFQERMAEEQKELEDEGEIKAVKERLEKEFLDEREELRKREEEVKLHAWLYSDLRKGCATIPAVWFYVLEDFRKQEELKGFARKKVKVTRSEWYECFTAMSQLGQPTRDGGAAEYELGNDIAFKFSLNMTALKKMIDEVNERRAKAFDEINGPLAEVKVSNEEEGAEVDPALKEETETVQDGIEGASGEGGPEGVGGVDEAKVESESEDEEVQAKKEKIEKDLEAYGEEEVEVSVYPVSIDEIPEKCATLPSDKLNALFPILKLEEEEKAKAAA